MPFGARADVAQLVEHHLAKVGVAGSNPVVRSRGRIHPGRIFDLEAERDGIAEACAAMEEHRAVESLMRLGPVGRETRR